MSADVPMHDSATAVECKDLWFSYEVAENIGATAAAASTRRASSTTWGRRW